MEGFSRLANMFGEGPTGAITEDEVDENGMPMKFKQNSFIEKGGGPLGIIGEALFDSYRRNKWEKQNPGAGMGPVLGPQGTEAAGAPGSPGAKKPRAAPWMPAEEEKAPYEIIDSGMPSMLYQQGGPYA
jgi:hypothetical protein